MCKGWCDGDGCNVRDCSRSGMSGMCYDINDDDRKTCEKTGKREEGCTQYEEDCPLKKKANENIAHWQKLMGVDKP